ncbi:MAG: hypothetical protein A2X36_12095 [Elusimicrobia bacterium GWA2_69_24]|nr:MAG: hypothetical protein A2X36_12095 [Elusimicrobia bacterium GWA2_69_24]
MERAIPGFKPALSRAESAALAQAFASGWVGTGLYAKLFERQFAAFAGARFATGTNSGTAALHLALRAAGVEGGEVITTPLTNAATSHAILYNRAAPVFCDVEAETGNIDPGKIESLITPRTRAIVAVHLHGRAAAMDAILALARRRRLRVVEDACQALRGTFRGRPLGTLGDFGCFSFGRAKSLTTVQGGAIVAREKRWIPLLRRLCRLGYSEEGESVSEPGLIRELGFHCGLGDTAAAIGLAQLERWGAIEARLRALTARYRRGLAGLPWLRLPESAPGSEPGWSHFAVRTAPGRRDRLARWLQGRGIGAEVWLYPNHFYILYKPYRKKLPVAERLWREFWSLPFYPALRDEEADRVADAIRRFKA